MNHEVILVVEDDPRFAKLVTDLLCKEEIPNEVVVARDGVEAIDYLFGSGRDDDRGNMPCLVLLDLHMPRLDGFGVLRKMRAEQRTRLVPVVIVSSSNHPVDIQTAYQLGANSYLNKASMRVPWPEMLRSVVHYWLRVNECPYCVLREVAPARYC